jgi:hypothetical protein
MSRVIQKKIGRSALVPKRLNKPFDGLRRLKLNPSALVFTSRMVGIHPYYQREFGFWHN